MINFIQMLVFDIIKYINIADTNNITISLYH
jgi:hypothetical protein